MRTGKNVHQLGLYKSSCCDSEILFFRGDEFSHCPQCIERCVWQLTEPVLTWREFDQLHSDMELIAA